MTNRRARVAALKRHRPAGDPAIVNAERELAAEMLASHVRRIVDAAPPLTREQRARISALLRPAPRDGAA
ncbi:hypothetical protein ACU61A_28505 [Pseudonocardia sichuanensis]